MPALRQLHTTIERDIPLSVLSNLPHASRARVQTCGKGPCTVKFVRLLMGGSLRGRFSLLCADHIALDIKLGSVAQSSISTHLSWTFRSGTSGYNRASGTNTGTRSRTEHRYTLTNSNKRRWLTLKVPSHSPTPAHLPSLFEDEAIAGAVELNLEREETIKSITVVIQGQMTESTINVYNFLNLSQNLYSAPSTNPAASVPSLSAGGRLRGMHAWTFSLTMPPHVTLNLGGGSSKAYRLPPSFSERMARVHIQYRLNVRVRRGRFRVDSDLGTVFSYTPITQPDPPSMKAVTCTLWLAKPLCYTRGSVIPCMMTIETGDSQALDVLSSPKAVIVRLRRHISMGLANISDMNSRSVRGVPYEPTVQDVKTALWWAPESRNASVSKRTLHGEILLGLALKPSCELGDFKLSYSVALYPLKAVAFAHAEDCERPLQREFVGIATAYSSGPRPIVYSPPDYDDTYPSSTGQAAGFNLFRGTS
ncbi:hypothetical protein SCP_0503920 [Sparassis crispa]|uniref:Arrestin-like N-terminal domain-containing protein n=1 Tax=Sparassis crispa TaxID=139825 RepID=A0A401GNM3_9APHY|nr:hypothetical protein SCP_0503920 [Sparassis crispa]GBE83344.1 hypothetical protein SCP_0503920 [Sparassis crispa]